MHQTTVRFGTGLWADLAREASLEHVSVAQFVREAAVARLALIESQRRQTVHELAFVGPAGIEQAVSGALETVSESAAVWSQSRRARERAAELRDDAERLRRQLYRVASPSRPPA